MKTTEMLALSPELCGRIVQVASNRRQDLLALCLTCKAFQREAEVRIYTQLVFTEPEKVLCACSTVINNERLAICVRTFWFNQDTRRSPPNLGQPFWSALQAALIVMPNIESLLLCDNSYANSWILDNPRIQLRLREAKLRLTWDAHLIRFLENQSSLRSLHLYDPVEEVITGVLSPNAVPDLQTFDGSLMIGIQFLPSSISHIQLIVDCDPDQFLDILARFGIVCKTLRALSLLDIPEEAALGALKIISEVLPDIRYLGLLPYPITNVSSFFHGLLGSLKKYGRGQRHEFHKYLMGMHYLTSIELDIGKWIPAPNLPTGQRALAGELKIFCPSITSVVFWMGNTKIRWTFADQWHSRVELQQYPQFSDAWCLA